MRENPFVHTISRGGVTLEFADTGPRITALRIHGGENLFAELPDAVIERAGGPPYQLVGGHRLWRAPEVPEVTYIPDDDLAAITKQDATVRARGVADPDGVVKEIEATITPSGAVTVDHRVVNAGPRPIEVAPWAITQFPPDGNAVMPIAGASGDAGEFRANRSVVLWPYTNPGADGIQWSRDSVVVTGGDGSKQKVGTENHLGWLGYQRGTHLFVKWGEPLGSADRSVDRGATAQVYRDHRFIELETVGAFRCLEPGTEIVHREVWRVFETEPPAGGDLARRVVDLVAGEESGPFVTSRGSG